MKNNINKILDFIITVLVYDLVLILVSNITNTLVIDSSYYGLYSLLGAIIICILNTYYVCFMIFYTYIPVRS